MLNKMYFFVVIFFSFQLSADESSSDKKVENKISTFKDPISGQTVSINWNSWDYFSATEESDLGNEEITIYDVFYAEKSEKLAQGMTFLHAVVSNPNKSDLHLEISGIRPVLIFNRKVETIEGWFGRGICPLTEVKKIPSYRDYVANGEPITFRYFLFENNKVKEELKLSDGFMTIPAQRDVLILWSIKPKPLIGRFVPLLRQGEFPQDQTCLPDMYADVTEACDKFTQNYFFNQCDMVPYEDNEGIMRYKLHYNSVTDMEMQLRNNMRIFIKEWAQSKKTDFSILVTRNVSK